MAHERRAFFEIDSDNFSLPVEIELDHDQSHHLKNVLRLPPGGQLVAVNRKTGAEYQAIVSCSQANLKLKLLSKQVVITWDNPLHTLIFAMCKGKRTDLVVEKGCELGVGRIIFWQASRSIVKPALTADASKKLTRWTRIAESAAKQSLKNRASEIFYAPSLSNVFQQLDQTEGPPGIALACSLSAQAAQLNELERRSTPVHLLIGPEGDLTSDEESALVEHGFQLVSLGPYLLRSETAALVGIAMVQALWGFERNNALP